MTRKHYRFVICLTKDEENISLHQWKVYRSLPLLEGDEPGSIRIIDESEEDYYYPSSMFVEISLPQQVAEAYRQAV